MEHDKRHFQKGDSFIVMEAGGGVSHRKTYDDAIDHLRSHDGVPADGKFTVLSMGPIHIVRRSTVEEGEQHVVSSLSEERATAPKTTEEGKEEKPQ